MAITLIEAAKAVQDPLRESVIMEFASSSELLTAMPFNDIAGGAYVYNRTKALPGVAFRGVNESYSESTGVINPQVETLAIAGGDIDVDRFLLNTMPNRREIEESMQIVALAHGVERAFIKGDSIATNGREPDGLQKRLTGSQLVENAVNGAALSLDKLDELIDAVKMPTHLLMNKRMRTRLSQASRNTSVGGFITFEQDMFGRKVAAYQDLPIITIDDDDRETAVLPFTEVQGNTSTNTSIYCLSLGDGMMSGLQNGTMDVRDLGELDSKPVVRTRIEWYCSFAIMHGRAAARLAGVQDAAVTV